MKSRSYVVSVTGAIACIAALLYFLLFGVPFRGEKGRGQIVSLYDSLTTGMTAAEVEINIAQGSFALLRLRKVSDTNWVVQSPMETGARNWDLWLEFRSNKLATAKVRLADTKERKPSDAPIDKFFSN